MEQRKDPANVRVICIYSFDRAPHVQRIADEVQANGWQLVLWARDEIHPALAQWTVRCDDEPRGRFHKVNQLTVGQSAEIDLIVCDDDVEISRGSLRRLVTESKRRKFVLSQPSHAANSFASHAFTRTVPWSLARETRFVEIGPVIFLDSSATAHFLPFPEDSPLGWGVEIDWDALRRVHKHRIGIIDAVQIRHLYPPGKYAPEVRRAEVDAIARKLEVAGLMDFKDLMVVVQNHWRRAQMPIQMAARLWRLASRPRRPR